MKKWHVATIVLIVIAIFIAWNSSQNANQENKSIKIGIVAPLTGGASAYGTTLVQGVEMALDDLSKKNTKFSYSIVVEDDGGNSATAASAASKLINVDKVKAIITTTSISGNAVKNQIANSNVIHICDCTDVTIGNLPNNYTNLILPVDETRVWLEEATKRGNKTVGILSQIHPGAKVLVDALLSQVASSSIKVVMNDSFDGNNRDFKSTVLKAKSSKADIYLIIAFPPALDILSKEMINAGLKNISTTGLFTVSPQPSLYNGDWYTDAKLTDINLMKRFIEKNPQSRFNARTVPYGYDILNMLVQSFEKEGDATANISAITEYYGVVGKITKSPNSNNFRSEPAIWMVKDGKFEQVSND